MTIMDSFVGRRFFSTEPIDVGVRWMVDMVESDRYLEKTGLFYGEGEVTDQSEDVLNEDNQKKIWNICVKYSQL